jgi:hypothetical protein
MDLVDRPFVGGGTDLARPGLRRSGDRSTFSTTRSHTLPGQKIFVHRDDEVSDLVVNKHVLTVTDNHPFWSVTDQRFEPAAQLSPGERVLSEDGRILTVDAHNLATRHEADAYNLSISNIHTYSVGTDAIVVHNVCSLIPADGARMSVDDALTRAEAWLGEGYTEPVAGSGRFVSADSARAVRMGDSDILGRHAGGPHFNFETLEPNPARPGRMMVGQNSHVYLTDW